MKNLMLIISTLFVTGCVSSYKQTQQQCSVLDWNRLGFMTGQSGQVSPTKANKQQFGECQKVDIKPDYTAFLAGVKEGLKSYCQPQVAEKIGAQGSDFDFSLCQNSSLITELKKSHLSGVSHYCKTSGYAAGLQGAVLQVSCPKDTTAIFNSDFQRGRTDLLLKKVNGLDDQLTAMRKQMRNLEEKNDDLERLNRDLQLKLEDTQRKLSK